MCTALTEERRAGPRVGTGQPHASVAPGPGTASASSDRWECVRLRAGPGGPGGLASARAWAGGPLQGRRLAHGTGGAPGDSAVSQDRVPVDVRLGRRRDPGCKFLSHLRLSRTPKRSKSGHARAENVRAEGAACVRWGRSAAVMSQACPTGGPPAPAPGTGLQGREAVPSRQLVLCFLQVAFSDLQS